MSDPMREANLRRQNNTVKYFSSSEFKAYVAECKLLEGRTLERRLSGINSELGHTGHVREMVIAEIRRQVASE